MNGITKLPLHPSALVTQRRPNLLGVVPSVHASRPVVGIALNVVVVPEDAGPHAITPLFFSKVVEVIAAVEDGSEAVDGADGGGAGSLA